MSSDNTNPFNAAFRVRSVAVASRSSPCRRNLPVTAPGMRFSTPPDNGPRIVGGMRCACGIAVVQPIMERLESLVRIDLATSLNPSTATNEQKEEEVL
ncbi:hypothetical protein [Nocardia huaxiensis]|uniref:Uncharacterized protein n=1 Tax=Nocardia huaxiensis TaxID=2755382 RepID=A0A7D6V8B4_9NOCA|nr:hypothetical protein [Nocardia huaxiensis]QLY30192.1 hypothetical protein H0264_34355 [Nocardia huaxiensis]UFS96193.1 hypothetical protein LPY97_37095 [Nocardia huaxiensis]